MADLNLPDPQPQMSPQTGEPPVDTAVMARAIEVLMERETAAAEKRANAASGEEPRRYSPAKWAQKKSRRRMAAKSRRRQR